MNTPRYFGVTSVQTLEQLDLLKAEVHTDLLEKMGVKLMVGILYASPAVSHEQKKIFRHVAAAPQQVAMTCRASQLGLFPVHHIEFTKCWPIDLNEKEDENWFISHLERLHELASPSPYWPEILTIQVNGYKPADFYQNVAQAAALKGYQIQFIYQLRTQEIKLLQGPSKAKVLEKLKHLNPFLGGIICDTSAGTGACFDLAPTLELLQILKSNLPEIENICLAGGLSVQSDSLRSYTYQVVSEATGLFPGLSFDHETGARISRGDGKTDQFSVEAAANCLNSIIKASAKRFKQH